MKSTATPAPPYGGIVNKWDVKQCDIRELNGSGFRGIDLLAGGLPCPPFSVAGKQLGYADERDLFPAALRLVDESRPRCVMIENVRGLLDARFEGYRESILIRLKKLGYQAGWRLLDACDYGVSQYRKRAILVAIEKGMSHKFHWPEPSVVRPPTVGEMLYCDMASRGWRKVEEWSLGANDLAPTIVGGSLKHGGPDLGPVRARKAWAALGVDGKGVADEPPEPDFAQMPRLYGSDGLQVAELSRYLDFRWQQDTGLQAGGQCFPSSCGAGSRTADNLGADRTKASSGRVVVGEPVIASARAAFHQALLNGVLRVDPNGVPSNADKSSNISVAIAQGIVSQLRPNTTEQRLSGQRAGSRFEQVCENYISATFLRFQHLRPGKWNVGRSGMNIERFEQYQHLKELGELAKENPGLASALGSDYLIKPDIVIGRNPESDDSINEPYIIVDETLASYTNVRAANNSLPILHASISCKWTIRSDRAQNARSEALNLIRNRKGRLPHIVVVTGEPLPSRIASIALGTGDIDCVYHFALPELVEALENLDYPDAREMVKIMVDGRRLRDIADLPLDLAA